MKLNAPQQTTWTIALIIGLVAILSVLITIPTLSGIAFWLMAIAWALLLLGSYLKGL